MVGRTRSFHILLWPGSLDAGVCPSLRKVEMFLPFAHSVGGEDCTDMANLPLRTSQTVANITFPKGLGRGLRQAVRKLKIWGPPESTWPTSATWKFKSGQ